MAGHSWGAGSLPEALGELVGLGRLDLAGRPLLLAWLRDPDARRRHSLGPSRDSSRVSLQVGRGGGEREREIRGRDRVRDGDS